MRRTRHIHSLKNRINGFDKPLEYAQSNVERVIRVQNDFFTAGAVFRRKDGIWHCIEAAPIINWMRKTPFDRIKLELLKRGCSWEWLPPQVAQKSCGGLDPETAAGRLSAPSAQEQVPS